MAALESRAMQDWMTSVTQRLDRLERDVPMGYGLPYTPVVTMTGVACTQGSNTGFWCRFNDLLIAWFQVIIGATPGTGTLRISTPNNIELDETVVGGRPYYGNWWATRAGLGTEGMGKIEPVSGSTAKLELIWRSAAPTGPATVYTNATPWAIATNDVIWGNVVAKVADP